MRTRPLYLAGIAMLSIFASCSDDDSPLSVPISSSDPVFGYYTVERKIINEDGTEQRSSFRTSNLQGQKLYSETSEDFIDNVGQGETTTQHYFYENNLLTKQEYEGDVKEFFYDAQARLIAINWLFGNTPRYYRFVHLSPSNVYFEKLTMAYDDPATTVQLRYILEFDASDNIVKAGIDIGLDGTIDVFNTFEYDTASNLTAIHKSDGTTLSLAYSPIKDNFSQLAFNTFGKKNLMIYQTEHYANAIVHHLRQSPNLRDTDMQESLIETQVLPFYFRKTQTSGNEKTITTFYFE